MSLLKQLFLAICLFLVVAFSGSFFASLESSREQLLSQLRSHAQDAATALGVSLTPQLDDPAMVELLVSSIFDSGYYASIRVVSIPDNQVLVERQADPEDNVPNWFAHLVGIDAQGGDAIIMRGWQQAARVEVQSHPRFALERLWDSALGSLGWLLLCGLLSAVFGGWLLRHQLRPLDAMVGQANAISHREFLTLQRIPRTPELRRVVLAMNQMVEKLKALFSEEAARSEKLREEAYSDSLTGLANRRLFDTRLTNQLLETEQNSAGYVLTLRLNDLAGLNQRKGGQHTDALIKAVGEMLDRIRQEPSHNHWLAARNRGGEFSLMAPGLGHGEAERLAAQLSDSLENLRLIEASDCTPVAHVGAVPYRPGETLHTVLLHLDQALTQAQDHPEKPWALLESFQSMTSLPQQQWHDLLDRALDEGQLQLYFQPVVSCQAPHDLLHHKVLARVIGPDGTAIPAGQFLPWIERLGWSGRFDLAMLEKTLTFVAQHPQALALSLSAHTLLEADNFSRMLTLLRRHQSQAGWLTLEADERHLPQADALLRMAQSIREAGYRFGVQHFGGQFSRIGNLTHLGLAYLKIDGTYIRDIDQQHDKRLFIEAMLRATHSIDLPLIAEMVETAGELAVLQELGLSGVMGRLMGAPAPGVPLTPSKN